jgi:hypothetical protein
VAKNPQNPPLVPKDGGVVPETENKAESPRERILRQVSKGHCNFLIVNNHEKKDTPAFSENNIHDPHNRTKIEKSTVTSGTKSTGPGSLNYLAPDLKEYLDKKRAAHVAAAGIDPEWQFKKKWKNKRFRDIVKYVLITFNFEPTYDHYVLLDPVLNYEAICLNDLRRKGIIK